MLEFISFAIGGLVILVVTEIVGFEQSAIILLFLIAYELISMRMEDKK